ncbi:NUDIX hydrolase [Thalassobacillus sp. CUG 92003]|uniref:NUDIX hydrolase n=1 Tax=Thalassobacillus sp. CUG 92003 TaxID=2736641 RepID=UPI0015E6853F|nr:NUDIX domain-containing protein [Thalassobacillus sp. CUG 92003]
MTTSYVNWGTSTVKLTWHSTQELPDIANVTSVHGVCFYEDSLMVIDLANRGWDLPGGHIEAHESPLDCCKREVMEEGYVEGDCHQLGYIEVDHTENPGWDHKSPYPKVGYQVFYRMQIHYLHPFKAEHESRKRQFINPIEINDYAHNWHDVYQHILADATSDKN